MIQELTNNQNRYNKCSNCSNSEKGLSAVSWTRLNIQVEQILCDRCLEDIILKKGRIHSDTINSEPVIYSKKPED